MKAKNYDQRALQVARKLHQTEQPEVTILFGSRARGDYREGLSDIDIMLVQETEPSKEQRSRAEETAREAATSVYEEAGYKEGARTQIIWQTSEEFDRMRRTVNHLVAKALGEGIVMPRDLEEYGNSYNDDFDPEENEWAVTDQRERHAKIHFDDFNNAVDSGREDILIGQQAQQAMEHALKALISANGAQFQRTHDIAQLAAHAREVDAGFRFELAVAGKIHSEYAGSNEYYDPREPISGIPNFRELVNSDVQAVLDRLEEVKESRQSRYRNAGGQ